MKNAKKNYVFFGAVLVTIIMMSGTTIGTVTQLNKSPMLKSDSSSDITCVEPNIYLSGTKQRKILSDSLHYIDAQDARVLIQAIVAEMDSKGFVNSYDIEQIVNEYNLEFSLITGIGTSITTGAYPNPGYAIRLANPFQKSGTIVLGLLFWNAKHSYNPSRDINITITSSGAKQYIDIDKMGLSVGFSGTFARGEEETGKWFTMQGTVLMNLVFG